MSLRTILGAQGASWASPDCSTPVCALLGLRAGRSAVDEALVRRPSAGGVTSTPHRLPLGPVFFAVTTQSVSLPPQFEHRKRSLISGTSPQCCP